MTFSARMMAQANGHNDSASSGSSTRTQSPASTLRMPYDALQEVSADFSGEENVERLRKLQYNFRSDTFSMQTDAQMLAALRASRGDNAYNEDEDTIALEERVAKMCGKEAAMFTVSGTLTNQLAIRTHLHQPPYSLICDFRAHVHKMEAGGIAMFTGATTHQLFPSNDIHLTAEDIEPHLELGDNIHIAPTALICLENTLSGTVLPQEEILKIKALSAKHDIALHLDGARLWNVAAKVITDRGLDATSEETRRMVMTELVEPFDTASLCLSKGIGAPIGSMLVGTKAFIKKARWFRKMYGAGVRQIGMCSAAADYALTHHFPRLEFTHKMAQRMEQGLRDLGCDILAPVDTSMVFWDPQPIGLTMDAVMARLQAHDPPIHCLRERIVMHHQVSPDAIEAFIHIVKEMKEEVEAKGPIMNKQAAKGLKEDFKSEGKLRKKVLGY